MGAQILRFPSDSATTTATTERKASTLSLADKLQYIALVAPAQVQSIERFVDRLLVRLPPPTDRSA